MDFDKLYDMFCEYYKDDGSNDAIMKGRIEKAFLEYAHQQFKILNLADVSDTLTYDELKLIIKESCDIEDVRKKIDHRLG